LKYGHSGFSLDILEYCGEGVVIEKEQYYMDLLNPEYNILKTAGSTKDYKHTEETLAKFRARLYSAEHMAMLKENQSKFNSEEQRAESRERMLEINKRKGIRVEVIDLDTNITTTYDSIRKAAESIGCAKNAIICYEKQQQKTGVVINLRGGEG
jgi:group I intron endonuclease